VSETENFKRSTFEPNRPIFNEGDAADTVYILRSGAVEIRIGTHSDNPRTLTTVKVGDVFGELALLENRSHGAAAIALTASEVLEVPRAEFIKRLNASDPVMKTVVNHLVSRLREMTNAFKGRDSPS
jgi:NTE family protein